MNKITNKSLVLNLFVILILFVFFRRSLLSKSPTPNTLSVQVPVYSSLGQSLPNLTLATSQQTSTVSATPPNSLLIVPQITKSKDTLLSPDHRGMLILIFYSMNDINHVMNIYYILILKTVEKR